MCWNVCNFGGEGYDRFGVSFECGTISNPFVFIDGKQLRDAINNDAPADKCQRPRNWLILVFGEPLGDLPSSAPVKQVLGR